MFKLRLFLLMFALVITTSLHAARMPSAPAECFLDIEDEQCYRPGTCSVVIKGGLQPTWFLTRSKSLFFAQPSGTSLDPFTDGLQKFHRQYDMPWMAGGECAYMTCNRIEFFVDGDYTSACNKKVKLKTGTNSHAHVKYSIYRGTAGYAGVRFYSASFWCCNFTAFCGAKLGVLYRRHARGTYCFTSSGGSENGTKALSFKKGYVPTGGLQTGINYNSCGCLSLVLKAEILFSGCWKTTDFGRSQPIPYVVLGHTGVVMSVPITFGIRASY